MNLRDEGAQSVEISTISQMECLNNETPQFDEKFVKVQFDKKFVKVDASKTIVNKENLNLGDEGTQSVENSTISHMTIKHHNLTKNL